MYEPEPAGRTPAAVRLVAALKQPAAPQPVACCPTAVPQGLLTLPRSSAMLDA
jgi:hypothetical protein